MREFYIVSKYSLMSDFFVTSQDFPGSKVGRSVCKLTSFHKTADTKLHGEIVFLRPQWDYIL